MASTGQAQSVRAEQVRVPNEDKTLKEIKILMLHGYTQSGPLFRAKTRALEKMLQKSLAPFKLSPVLIYPTAPNRLRPQDIPGYELKSENDEEQNEEYDSWAWWRRDDASGVYRLFGGGMASLATTIGGAGGVDAVLGFSQGAAAAALLAAALEHPRRELPVTESSVYDWSWVSAVRAANDERALRFAIIYSGFHATPAELQWLYDPHIATPTLQFIGGLDTVVDESRSRALADRCVDPVVIVHPGGHYVPIKKEWVMPVAAFVKKHSEFPGPDSTQASI